jgi:hypothetical protein
LFCNQTTGGFKAATSSRAAGWAGIGTISEPSRQVQPIGTVFAKHICWFDVAVPDMQLKEVVWFSLNSTQRSRSSVLVLVLVFMLAAN